jgi:hypothetical protein
MPRVPYQPYSDVAPSGAEVNIATPEGAFGGLVARATREAGAEVAGVGDKLFNRAVAFQQLNNETEAEKGNLQLMGEAGDLHAKYNALQGEERVKAFPKYKQDIFDIQSRIRNGLSNDMARRMFDRSSNYTVGHSIFNAAGAAATAQREWGARTADATSDMAVKSVSDDPTNQNLWDVRKQDIISAEIKSAYMKYGAGPNDAITKDAIMKKLSLARREQIMSVKNANPEQAEEMKQQALKNNELTAPDALAVDNAIQAKFLTVGATRIADDVYKRGVKEGKTLKQMEDEARAKAERDHPNSPLLPKHAADTVNAYFNQDNHAEAIEDRKGKDAIKQYIINNDIKTDAELKANPEMARIFDNIKDNNWKGGLPRWINGWQKAKTEVANDQNFNDLWGMYRTNPIGFRDVDLTKYQLGPKLHGLQQLQLKIKENAEKDPLVQRVISQMKPIFATEMKNLGVYAPPTGDAQNTVESDYNRFAGGVAAVVDAFVEQYGRQPKYSEIRDEIGPNVLKQISEPGAIFGSRWPTKYTFWNPKGKALDEYNKFVEAEKKAATDEDRAQPLESQLQQAWSRIQYMKMTRKKPSGE